MVAGNYVGTNNAGTANLSNTAQGVAVGSGAMGNRIGTDTNNNGFDANERNVIAGNASHGVYVQGLVVSTLATADALIAGTYARTTATGTISKADLSAGPSVLPACSMSLV